MATAVKIFRSSNFNSLQSNIAAWLTSVNGTQVVTNCTCDYDGTYVTIIAEYSDIAGIDNHIKVFRNISIANIETDINAYIATESVAGFNSPTIFSGANVGITNSAANNTILFCVVHTTDTNLASTFASAGTVSDFIFTDANGFVGNVSTSTTTPTLELTTSLTQGSIVFIGAAGAITEDNSNLFYDNVNNWTGFGTSSPLGRVHIEGVGIGTGITARITNNTPAIMFEILDNGRWSLGQSCGLGTDFTCVNIGFSCTSTGSASIAMGSLAIAGIRGIASGDQAFANDYNIASGYLAQGTIAGANSITFGNVSTSAALDSITFGELLTNNGVGSTLIGGSNQGNITVSINGSFQWNSEFNTGTAIAKQSFFMLHTSNILLQNGVAVTATGGLVTIGNNLDPVPQNVLTIHVGATPTAITATSVVDQGGAAWFTHAGTSTFTQKQSGVEVTLSGSGVYANGVYFAHWQNNTQVSLHPTRVDALDITNALAFISNEVGALLTFSPLSPSSTGLITNASQIYTFDRGGTDGKAGTAIQAEDGTQHIFSDRVGFGTLSPTALVHIVAGTTASAQLRLAAGVAPSSPNDGDIYYIDTNDRLMFFKNATASEIISASAVTTETVVSDTTLTITFNGGAYKLLAQEI